MNKIFNKIDFNIIKVVAAILAIPMLICFLLCIAVKSYGERWYPIIVVFLLFTLLNFLLEKMLWIKKSKERKYFVQIISVIIIVVALVII